MVQQSRNALAALLALLAASCVVPQRDAPRETLDEDTGATVIAMGKPLEFYSPRPDLGLQAASFAHLGALEVNRMGQRRLLLWLSVLPSGATAAQPAAAADEPRGVTLIADAKESTPDLVATDARELGLGRVPFKRPAEWARDGYFDVGIELLRQLETAGSLELAITAADGRVQRYELWNADRASLARFIEKITDQ